MEDINACDLEEEYYCNDGVFCPHCQHYMPASDSDGLLYDDTLEEYCCGSCGENFEVSLYISYSWTIPKIKEKQNDRH